MRWAGHTARIDKLEINSEFLLKSTESQGQMNLLKRRSSATKLLGVTYRQIVIFGGHCRQSVVNATKYTQI